MLAASLILAAFCQAGVASGAGGTDPGFGINGSVTTDFVGENDSGRAIGIQSDGKILVAGTARIGGVEHFGIVRYHLDGTLDASFGIGGKVTLLIGERSEASSLALQRDGKILVAGSAVVSELWSFVLARFLPNGELDRGFSVDGIVTKALSNRQTDGSFCSSVAVELDGRILLGGHVDSYYHTPYFALVRYLDNGDLDSQFGSGGVVLTPAGSPQPKSNAMTLQADGKIVHAGSAGVNTQSDMVIFRHLPDGSLDPRFGADGKRTVDFSNNLDSAHGIAIDRHGKIVVVGRTYTGSEERGAVVRLLPGGSLDNGFGDGGKTTLFAGDHHFSLHAVEVQADDRILVAGARGPVTAGRATIARLRANGSVDAGFWGRWFRRAFDHG